jgi:hypothetical protein
MLRLRRQLISGCANPAAELFGIWLGTRLSRRKDQQQWRRDRCLEAYTDVLRACSIMLDQGMIDWIKKAEGFERLVGGDVEINHIDLVTKNSRNLYHAVDRVSLLAPTEVYESIKELADHCMKFTRASLGNNTPSSEEWSKISEKYTILYDKFKDAARNELLKN